MLEIISTVDFRPHHNLDGMDTTISAELVHPDTGESTFANLNVYSPRIPPDAAGDALTEILEDSTPWVTRGTCHGWTLLFQHPHSQIMVFRHEFDS